MAGRVVGTIYIPRQYTMASVIRLDIGVFSCLNTLQLSLSSTGAMTQYVKRGEPRMSSKQNIRLQASFAERKAYGARRKFARELQGHVVGILTDDATKHLVCFGIFSKEKLSAEEMNFRTHTYANAFSGHWEVIAVDKIDDLGRQGWIFKKTL